MPAKDGSSRHRLACEGMAVWNGGADMNRIGIVLVVIAGLVGAGLFALSAWKIPAPTVAVNKVVPDDRLPN